jgi:hypothetical protein
VSEGGLEPVSPGSLTCGYSNPPTAEPRPIALECYRVTWRVITDIPPGYVRQVTERHRSLMRESAQAASNLGGRVAAGGTPARQRQYGRTSRVIDPSILNRAVRARNRCRSEGRSGSRSGSRSGAAGAAPPRRPGHTRDRVTSAAATPGAAARSAPAGDGGTCATHGRRHEHSTGPQGAPGACPGRSAGLGADDHPRAAPPARAGRARQRLTGPVRAPAVTAGTLATRHGRRRQPARGRQRASARDRPRAACPRGDTRLNPMGGASPGHAHQPSNSTKRPPGR